MSYLKSDLANIEIFKRKRNLDVFYEPEKIVKWIKLAEIALSRKLWDYPERMRVWLQMTEFKTSFLCLKGNENVIPFRAYVTKSECWLELKR